MMCLRVFVFECCYVSSWWLLRNFINKNYGWIFQYKSFGWNKRMDTSHCWFGECQSSQKFHRESRYFENNNRFFFGSVGMRIETFIGLWCTKEVFLHWCYDNRFCTGNCHKIHNHSKSILCSRGFSHIDQLNKDQPHQCEQFQYNLRPKELHTPLRYQGSLDSWWSCDG